MAYVLATSVKDVEHYLLNSNPDRMMGLDTEGTSLDTRKCRLVGFSISLHKEEAMYVPLAHRIGENVPWEPCVGLLREMEEDGYTFAMHNAKYDLNVIQRNTKWAPKRYTDTLEMVYMTDPDRMRKGLKEVAKTDLGMDMEKFEDLFTPEEKKAKIFDISTKSPQRCTSYAAADADATLRTWYHYRPILTSQEFAIKIDTKLIEVVRRMEHNGGLELNEEYIDEQIRVLAARVIALEEQIYRQVGFKFDIGSPKQLGIALFDRMGIPSPGTTKGGGYKTDAETLEKLAKTYPMVELIITYRKVAKASGTYFHKLKKLAKLNIPVRFQFNIYSAPTFRFAAPGGDPNVDGGTGVNIQAVSNGEARDLMAVDLSIEGGSDEYVKDLDEEELLFTEAKSQVDEGVIITPWNGKLNDLPYVVENEDDEPKQMCFRETCLSCPAKCADKGIDVTRRMQKNLKLIPSVRQAFRAPKGHTLVSFDYDRQEMVIGANMSGEPRWLNALAKGDDMHCITAASAYGMPLEQFMKLPKGEYSRKRGVGKVLNFATFYGATAYTLARKADLSKAQAEQIYDGFVKAHPQLFSWMKKVHIFARREGYTTTFFGRKRYLHQFYSSPDKQMQNFADRSAVNTAIQGTAAEVTRIAMVKVAAGLEKAGYKQDQVRFVMMVHDELVFLIKDELLKKVCPIIKENMEFKVKAWQVQLTVAPKIGTVWGQQKEVKNYAEWLQAA